MSVPSSETIVPYKVALIGCGRPLRTVGATGFGMAHRHLAGYRASGRAELVAVVDLHRANAEAFIAEHNPAARVYADAVAMMEAEEPDVVSVCLWPHLHAEVVCALAPFRPKLIFCEKPMDTHWEGALRMHAVCREHGVTLAINHQRRFNLPLLEARRLLADGAIGPLRQIEGAWHNLADTGSHVLDMMFYFNDDEPAEWVLGQVEMRGAKRFFGLLHAGQGITTFRFRNGVQATYHFGEGDAGVGCLLRLRGDSGTIEILFDEPWMRFRRDARAGWETVALGESIHDDKGIYRAIDHCLDCLESGEVSQFDSERALRATEVIFATHESARRRARVDLPLSPGPCALLEMIARGELELPPELRDPPAS
jgi:UDP-N-acetylglucosamine 3-dehydrogenase